MANSSIAKYLIPIGLPFLGFLLGAAVTYGALKTDIANLKNESDKLENAQRIIRSDLDGIKADLKWLKNYHMNNSRLNMSPNLERH